jgi:hypothetical protein
MHRRVRSLLLFAAALGTQPFVAAAPVTPSPHPVRAITPAFTRNIGQADPLARYVSVGGGWPIFFMSNDVRIVDPQRQRSLWLTFVDGAARDIDGERTTGGHVTVLRGASASVDAPIYRDIVYRHVWHGIDARVSAASTGLKYAFEVAPGADPRAIHLRYSGADRLELTSAGELAIDAGGTTMVDTRPVAYQEINGRSVSIGVRFVQFESDLTFAVGDYDRTKPLVIDPTLVYSTYLGGDGYDAGNAIAVDGTGAAYVAGTSRSVALPTTPGAYQTSFQGGSGSTATDAFVAKLNPAGTAFTYLTYLGGSHNDEAFGIAVDGGGNAYVTGFTESANFPTTAGAYRTAMGLSGHDGFLTKLNNTGSALVYSTYFGTNGSTDPAAVALDASGNAYVAGATYAGNLPLGPGARGFSNNGQGDGFLLKFNAAGSQVTYGTYAGGDRPDAATAVAVDTSGHAYITGWTTSLEGIAFAQSGQPVQPNPGGPTFRSTDGGQTFVSVNTPVHTIGAFAFAIDPSQPSTVYQASRETGLLKTTDAGAHWTQPGNFPATAGGDVVLNPATPATLLVASGADLYRSTDAGSTFTRVIAGGVAYAAFAPSHPSTAYAVWTLAYKSTDAGATWTPLTMPFASQMFAIAVDPGNDSVVYIGMAGGVWKTANGGSSWTLLTPPFTTSDHAVVSVAVDPTLTNVVWAGTPEGEVFRSNNGGASWTLMTSAGVHYAAKMVFDGGTLYIADDGRARQDGAIVTTTDRGVSFSRMLINGDNVPVFALAAVNGVIYAGSDILQAGDAFVWKIDTNATATSLMWGTYLGGGLDDIGRGIAVDSSGNPVIAVEAPSGDFPTTLAGTPRGSALVRMTSNGGLAISTFIGGAGLAPPALAKGLALDRNNNAYVTGVYGTSDQGVWVDRIDPSGVDNASFTINGTHSNLGGGPTDVPAGIAAGPTAGDVYVTGRTVSVDFPTTPTAPQQFYGSGESDAFISKVSFGDTPPPPPPGPNLALNKPVTASSVFASQYATANAVDGSLTTRWSSEFSDPQWISVDLQGTYDISEVILRWETAYGADYQVQVSNDATTWTTIRTVTGGDGGVDELTGLSGRARYVRINGARRGTEWGYSLWEFEVYGSFVSPPPGANLALNRPVVSSSDFSPAYAAPLAVDGDASTRWSSQFSDPQWIYVDLGARYNVTRVKLSWETAYAADFQLQISDDANTWTTFSTTTGNSQLTTDDGVSASGRYVRMYGTRRGTPWGYSLWTFEVYGDLLSTSTTDQALHRPAVSSSDFSTAYAARFAVDGDASTRWSSQFSDPQWIYVDFGQRIAVSEVVLGWETAYGRDYQVQVSDDAATWTTIRATADGNGGIDDLTGLSGIGRYLRIYGTKRGTEWGYSLWSLQVFGDPAP